MQRRGGDLTEARQGFTIVELLIVVVVIAILAAITIVAYNGIQNRATASSVQSSASQAGKKAQSYAVVNNELFPEESTYVSDLSLPTSSDKATYDYYVNTTRTAFCLSVTDTTRSPEVAYAYTNRSGGVVQGRCVKNLVTNPSFETLSGSSIPGITASSRVTVQTSSTGVQAGSRSVMITPTYASNTDTFADLSNWGIQASTAYAVSAKYTLTQALPNANPRFRFNIGGSDVQSPQGPRTVGTHQLSFVYTIPSSTAFNFLRIMPGGLLGDPPIYLDTLMVTQTPIVYQYGDGDSANWAWVGSPHASASFGPALPL